MKKKLNFIICARSGSERLPNKNSMPFIKNLSLLELAIKQSIRVEKLAKLFYNDIRIIVSTDLEILQGREFFLHKRKKEHCTSEASLYDVIGDICYDFNIDDSDDICLLQPTSPLRTDGDIIDCLSKRIQNNKPIVSVSEAFQPISDFINIATGQPMLNQVSNEYYFVTGAIYIFNKIDLNEYKSIPIFGKSIIYHISSQLCGWDIDHEYQFLIARLLYANISCNS